MIIESLYEFFLGLGVWLFIIGLSLFVVFIGIIFFYKSTEKYPKETVDFIKNCLAGVTGGLVIAIVLELRQDSTQNVFTYMLVMALIIFFIFVMSFIVTRMFRLNIKKETKISVTQPVNQMSIVQGKKSDKKFYEKIYPAVWSQYIFLTNSRDRAERRIEALLVIAGILITVFFSLGLSENPINWISIVGFTIILLISLYGLVPRKVTVPWVGIEEMDKYKAKKDISGFHKQLVEEAYRHIDDMNNYVDSRFRLLRYMIFILLGSVGVPVTYWLYPSYPFLSIIFTGLLIIYSLYINSIFGTLMTRK